MNPHQFQTIIVGLDFSPYSKNVLKQAIAIAGKKLRLVIVHTINTSYLVTGVNLFIGVRSGVIGPLTQDIKKFYKLDDLAPHAKVVVAFGNPADHIVRLAKTFPSPLIVIGQYGKSSLAGRLFLGSTAESIALRATSPVWIQKGSQIIHPQKILIPCDFSSRTENAIAIAKTLASTRKSHLELFHIEQDFFPEIGDSQLKDALKNFQEKETTFKKKFLKRYAKIKFFNKIGEPAAEIIKAAKKFDLVVMAPHRRRGLFSSFGSVTGKVVRAGTIPVLISRS
ncbi:MAG: hypothetical protein A2622_00360 [Bdellovibrionales bacterium RIFCSPHIGHO2_01_FULL_40_29]|nr:MAG: hypothetical protein A2622_00360 [Bdellovibrionales bacterium RIFCSPHIGHO2_01_FULL_40_29]OFZ32577.1 MAG: hypothetical protein A3D17_04960 [Bdellovibrionales bacterium RIFCSPHIGHO2_02_FULL_40_15]